MIEYQLEGKNSMIKIKDRSFETYRIEVIWKNFSVSSKNGKHQSGKAPLITFYLDDRIVIELELTCSKTMLLNTKINQRTNIRDYLSDITMEKEEVWSSLILGKYDCNITRINERMFHLDFYVEEEKTSLSINTDIELF